ncbi:MAG: helix-turn-helix transcriptional regulator [Ruminococcus sp.]|nr:helix-turn-helix transcriptional regulator [Ruminococcus sp.]
MIIIRRMGCGAEHDGNFEVNRPDGYDCCLLLFLKTKAKFILDGREVITEPDTFIAFNKYSPHKYSAYEGKYINHWLHIEFPDEIYSSMSALFDRPVHIGSSVKIDEYIHLISDAFCRTGTEKICACLITAMLEEIMDVLNQPHMQSTHFSNLVALRKDIYAHPEQDWTIRKMAGIIHVSEPYFQELYKKAFEISCGTDIIYSRIESAKILLTGTLLTASEIAIKCGYNSSVHFSRQFKQITGYSPVEYRRKML